MPAPQISLELNSPFFTDGNARSLQRPTFVQLVRGFRVRDGLLGLNIHLILASVRVWTETACLTY